MTATIQYRRMDPDTVRGEMLEVKIVYSSFDAKEIDEMQENIQAAIAAGLSEESEEQA